MPCDPPLLVSFLFCRASFTSLRDPSRSMLTAFLYGAVAEKERLTHSTSRLNVAGFLFDLPPMCGVPLVAHAGC